MSDAYTALASAIATPAKSPVTTAIKNIINMFNTLGMMELDGWRADVGAPVHGNAQELADHEMPKYYTAEYLVKKWTQIEMHDANDKPILGADGKTMMLKGAPNHVRTKEIKNVDGTTSTKLESVPMRRYRECNADALNHLYFILLAYINEIMRYGEAITARKFATPSKLNFQQIVDQIYQHTNNHPDMQNRVSVVQFIYDTIKTRSKNDDAIHDAMAALTGQAEINTWLNVYRTTLRKRFDNSFKKYTDASILEQTIISEFTNLFERFLIHISQQILTNYYDMNYSPTTSGHIIGILRSINAANATDTNNSLYAAIDSQFIHDVNQYVELQRAAVAPANPKKKPADGVAAAEAVPEQPEPAAEPEEVAAAVAATPTPEPEVKTKKSKAKVATEPAPTPTPTAETKPAKNKQPAAAVTPAAVTPTPAATTPTPTTKTNKNKQVTVVEPPKATPAPKQPAAAATAVVVVAADDDDADGDDYDDQPDDLGDYQEADDDE